MSDKKEVLIQEKEKRRKERILLEWSNINYSVALKKEKGAKVTPMEVNRESDGLNQNSNLSLEENKRLILRSISGFALPNELLAILGPSGCGKTSLLNIIACRQLSNDRNAKITRDVSSTILHNILNLIIFFIANFFTNN